MWLRVDTKRSRAAMKRWRDKNPDYQVAWNHANPEKKRAIARRTYSKPETKERLTRWRAANPDKVQAAHVRANRNDPPRNRQKRYRGRNPEVSATHSATRRLRKATGRLSKGLVALLMSEQGARCPYCLADLAVLPYAMDHFMPLALGGSHHDDNIQLTCRPCNARKSDKHPLIFMKEP